MHFIVTGLNHKSADIEIREKCCFSEEMLPDAINILMAYECIKGCVILSTCNRIEIYASVTDIEKAFQTISGFFGNFHNIPVEKLVPVIYTLNCEQAVKHLFKVVSGIDSMVVGEYQIQGQVRDAYTIAQKLNATDNYINKLFQSAISTGKLVRSETEIGKGSVSVANLAVEMIKQNVADNGKFNVLLVGAGEMAGVTAANLKKLNACNFSVANRSREKAEELARQFDALVVDYDNRYNAIANARVVVVSTGADYYTVEAEQVAKFVNAASLPKLFIDLSIPRNIDPAVNGLYNCQLYTIDDINRIIDLNISERAMEIDKAEAIIDEMADEYAAWYYKQVILPTMLEIKDKLDVLKHRTIASYKSEFGSLSDKQQELMKELLDTYSDKLIKVIMKNIRNFTSKDDMLAIAEALKSSFSIDTALGDDTHKTINKPHA